MKRILSTLVGGVSTFGGGVLARNISPFVVDNVAVQGLVETGIGAALAILSPFAPRSMRPLLEGVSAGAVAFGVSKIASDQAPGTFLDVESLPNFSSLPPSAPLKLQPMSVYAPSNMAAYTPTHMEEGAFPGPF